jgi:hypothetical protein
MAEMVAGVVGKLAGVVAGHAICGQCGQSKKQLSTLSTKERKPVKREKAPALFVDNVDNVPIVFQSRPELRRAAPLPYIYIFLRSNKITIHIVHTCPRIAVCLDPAWTIRAFSHCPHAAHIAHKFTNNPLDCRLCKTFFYNCVLISSRAILPGLKHKGDQKCKH